MSRAAVVLAALTLWTAPPAAYGQSCPDPVARQFDFWIGDWDIRQKILHSDGTWIELPAKTSVRRELRGCAIVEHWEGEVQYFWEGMTAPEQIEAISIRVADPDTGEWQIQWLDTRSPVLAPGYTGSFEEDGIGRFYRETEGPNGPQLARIIFSDITDDSVHWDLAISNDDGDNWLTLWIMEMKKEG